MDSKYDDYNTWVEVTLFEDSHQFGVCDKLSPSDLLEIAEDLIEQGIQSGLEGCYLKLQSHQDYDGYDDPPSMAVVGYRKKNEGELTHDAREKYINDTAERLGITPYHARQYVELEELGVVNV